MRIRKRKQGKRGAKKRQIERQHLLFLALIAPNFLLLGVFTYWPMIYQGYLSLTRWNMLAPQKNFVGLDNYASMFGIQRATKVTWEARTKGRAVAKTCHKELAELYEERLREKGLTVSTEPTR